MRRTSLAALALTVVVAIVVFATCDERRDAPGDVAPPPATASPPFAKPRAPRGRPEAPTPSAEAASSETATADATPVTAELRFNTFGAKVAAPRKVVRGRVVDPKGRPVWGADVEVVSLWLPADVARTERRHAYAHVATAQDGTFALPYFEGGPRGLIVKRGGYSSTWGRVVHDLGDDRVHEIVLPDRIPSVIVRVTRAVDGARVEAAEVRLALTAVAQLGGNDGPAQSQRIGSQREPGAYTFEEVAAGPATLYVAAPGSAPCTRQIEVAVEGDTTIDVALTPGVTVRGTVVDAATNNGIAGARVRWESRDSPGVAETICDGDGKFVLEHLPFGPNEEGLTSAGADGYADTLFAPSGLVDGATEGSATVILARPATVSVRCVDDARRPLMGVIVAAYSDYESSPLNGARTRAPSFASAPTEPDGRATLATLRPGNALRVVFYVNGVGVLRHTFPALVAGETRDLGDVVLAPPK